MFGLICKYKFINTIRNFLISNKPRLKWIVYSMILIYSYMYCNTTLSHSLTPEFVIGRTCECYAVKNMFQIMYQNRTQKSQFGLYLFAFSDGSLFEKKHCFKVKEKDDGKGTMLHRWPMMTQSCSYSAGSICIWSIRLSFLKHSDFWLLRFARVYQVNELSIETKHLFFFLFESPFICKLYKYIQQMV
jgi:hypothetical protein